MAIETIGVLTSGGDSPGMNAAIRAVVRTALYHKMKAFGFRHGYNGLINKDFIEMDRHSVGNILQRGGTILGTARSAEFKTAQGMGIAKKNLDELKIDSLVVIGGDGTMRGAHEFSNKFDFPVIGLPGTIDNDLFGTDFTIGFDTAINNALEAVDRIRDTASSLERVFFIEVMGRHAGFIGLAVGLAGGAEDVLIPETPTDIPALAKKINETMQCGKKFSIVIVAEGDEEGNAFEIAEKVKKLTKQDYRVAILGYIQRGGSPTAIDRIIAMRLGYAAVMNLRKGIHGCMVGEVNYKTVCTPFTETYTKKKHIDPELHKIIQMLAR
jgi:6-phosphofructokinase 1